MQKTNAKVKGEYIPLSKSRSNDIFSGIGHDGRKSSLLFYSCSDGKG